MNKAECRKQYLSKRKALTEKEWNLGNNKIIEQLLQICLKLKAGTGLLFYPIEAKKEVDLRQLPSIVARKTDQWNWCLPVMSTDNNLKAYRWQPNDPLKEVGFGVKEPHEKADALVKPSEVNLVVTPLLVADLRGYRVGYGKGYYDRFLSNPDLNAIKVGVCFFEPIQEISDINFWDQKIDYLICPSRTWIFTKK